MSWTTHTSKWTDDRVIRLKRLWLIDGFSFLEIAKDLGGVSRSSVSSKLRCLGLLGQKATRRKGQVERSRIGPAPTPVAKRVSKCGRFAYVVHAHPLMETTGAVKSSKPKVWTERQKGECAWIVEEAGADSVACCAPVDPESTHHWCRAHRKIGVSAVIRAQGSERPSKVAA